MARYRTAVVALTLSCCCVPVVQAARPATTAQEEAVAQPAGNANTLLPKTAWRIPLRKTPALGRGTIQQGQPVVVGDTVYVGSATAAVVAITTAGKPLWTYRTQGPVVAPVTLSNNIVFAPDTKGFVYAIHQTDGTEEWRVELGSELATRPLAVQQRLFVVTARGELVAIHAKTGNVEWRTTERLTAAPFLVKGGSDPLLAGGLIVAGFADGHVAAYDPQHGNIVWDHQVSPRNAVLHDVDMTPLLIGDQLLVASVGGGLSALHARTGRPLWRSPIASPNDLLLHGDYLYVSGGGKVYGLNLRNGSRQWLTDLPESEVSAPVLVNGHLVVVSTHNTLYLLDPQQGTLLASRPMGTGTYGRLTTDGNQLFILTNNNHLAALRFP
ncbi:MAG: PQQ-binding-like beta-propeller repeat protein [Deltaproteobacteria bacterium]|nr:PQQ-binding-like beta-propeller repeat protein [Deltaproteobacteria bacterium]